MIDGQSVVAIIPARGGSKGVPRKNLRVVGGKPLFAWTVETARRSRYIDRLVVSSEDPEVIAAARDLGCDVPFVRPADLARDDTPGVAPVLHALSQLPPFDLVVLLQPTSPLRSAEDIDGCIEGCARRDVNACVSVTAAKESPCWMFTLDPRGSLRPVLGQAEIPDRRQDLPPVYVLNGAVYVARCPWLEESGSFLTHETRGYVMPEQRSIDVDTPQDLDLVELMLGEGKREQT